jgi:hypothetical protein
MKQPKFNAVLARPRKSPDFDEIAGLCEARSGLGDQFKRLKLP